MDEFKVRTRLKHFNKIVPIEGGRYLRSRDIQDELLRVVRVGVSNSPGLSGYALVIWDDDEMISASVRQTEFGPFRLEDIPRFVKDELVSALFGTDDDDEDETCDDEE